MLHRRFTLLHAVSLNMSMMVGVGPFVTIPLLLQAVQGPQASWIWVIGAIVAACDGLVWSELAAAFPGSGGTYHFFDAVYGERPVGRALKFLFVWQFLLSGPLEMASGMLGFSMYAGSLWPALKGSLISVPMGFGLVWNVTGGNILAALTMASLVVLAYRRIETAGKLMVFLWLGMLATVFWVIAVSWAHFHPEMAFKVPPGAFTLSSAMFAGMGTALGLAMYTYFGYYQVCYLGDEVSDPSRTIPRSMLLAIAAVATIYLAMNVGILGAISWQDVMKSEYIGSDLMLKFYNQNWANLLSLLVMWSAVAGCFAALLGASRIPYAAAKAGHFFKVFASTHPTGDFPHLSLLLMGGVAILACLADLQTVIEALLTTRIVIQFMGQILTVIYLRTQPDMKARMPFRMPMFPLPAIVALIGWIWVFGASSRAALTVGSATIVVGMIAFLLWDKRVKGINEA
jgi:amino acid transporter